MNGSAQVFDNTESALNYLSGRYGTADWKSYEYIRAEFWSYQTYPEAGAVQFNFFGQTAGGTVTLADTNMQSAGVFQGGNHFLVQSIRCKFRIGTWDLGAFTGADSTTLVSDFLNGFCQCGVLKWLINAREYLTLPNPFLWAPPAGGAQDRRVAGNVSATVTAFPWATLLNNREGEFVLQPQVLIESGQTFNFQLNYPTGVVPVIGTTITDDATNPLKIGVEMSGQLFRPMQ